jgi:DNA polymerase-3 subunit delta
VDPALCRYLVDTCSADMFILANEAEKICAYALSVATDPQTPPILTKEMILLVCSPNKIFGAFDFANAVLEGNTAAALSVFADMKLRKEKPQDIIATISRITGELLTIRTLLENGMKREEISSALKMADYPLGLRITVAQKSTPEALRDTFFRCLEADRKLKSTSLNGYLVIEHLLLDNYQDVQEESS